jgi:hypothetical protein
MIVDHIRRIGMAIMVCFDFADIFLPLAKALRYLRLGNSLLLSLSRHIYSGDLT